MFLQYLDFYDILAKFGYFLMFLQYLDIFYVLPKDAQLHRYAVHSCNILMFFCVHAISYQQTIHKCISMSWNILIFLSYFDNMSIMSSAPGTHLQYLNTSECWLFVRDGKLEMAQFATKKLENVRTREEVIVTSKDARCKFYHLHYQARTLRALGLLLADGTPTVGGGKT